MNSFMNKIHWAITFVAFNCVFFPMHLLGEGGHMRRIATPTEYEFLQDMQYLNVFISWSAFILGAAQLIFIVNYFYSMFWGRRAEANPWESNSIEFSTPSPIPYYNYETIPTVYRGPYEYSAKDEEVEDKDDYSPMTEPGDDPAEGHH